MAPPEFTPMPFDELDREEYRSQFDDEELDIDEQIRSLRECIEKRDRYTLLEKITIGTYLSGNASALGIRDDMVGLPPALAEFVIGHLIVADDVDNQNPSYKMLSRAANRVAEAYQFSTIFDEDPDEWTDEEQYQHDAESALVLREIAAGRHYFWDQPLEAARRAYRPHNRMMEDLLGFTIDEAIDFQQHVEQVVTASFRVAMRPVHDAGIDLYSEGDSLDALQEFIKDSGRLPRFSELPDHEEDVKRIEQIYDVMGKKTAYMWVCESYLVKKLPDEADESKFRAFLDRFSVQLGEWDHPLGPEFWSIDDLNPLHLHPYIRRNDRILLPHVAIPRRALMTTFYYDLIQIDTYEGEFGNVWGEYIEDWAYDALTTLFDSDAVLLNPDYETNGGVVNEFTDLVVDAGDKIFLIECKAAKLNIDTRSGDFEALKRDLTSGVGRAASQLDDCLSALESANDLFLLETDERSYNLDLSADPDIVPMIVLGEQYDAISTNFYDIATDNVSFTPYVVNVMNLDIICEAFTKPDHFSQYVSDRTTQVQNNQFFSPDEIDYLGIFLEEDYEFPEIPEHTTFRDFSHVVREAIDDEYGP